MSLQNIKLITFDVTNTLLKFRLPPWHYYTLIAKEHGYKGTNEIIKTNLIGNMKVMWAKYPNYGKSSISWEKWWSHVVKMTLKDHLPATTDLDDIARKLINKFGTSECWCVAEGGHNLLDKLKNLNKPIGVISNFDPRLNDILQHLNLINYFDFIITSYDIGYSKPDERIFQSAIIKSKNDMQPSNALHIGDDFEKDYVGARAAGWNAILINSDVKSEEIPAPQHVFHSLKDLCTTIEQDKLIL